MADLSTSSSGYSTGATDTWTSQVANVSLYKAAHVNGLASAILQLETVLGSGSALPGALASLAARLAVQVGTDGVIIPPGVGAPYFGASAPTGWLFCDGSAVSRATFANLFTAIGITNGPGNGTTTFNLPDMRGRLPMGAGTGARSGESGTGVISGGTALTTRSLGAWGGEETHELTEDESFNHSHNYQTAQSGGAGFGRALGSDNSTNGGTGTTTSVGSSDPFNVTNPHLVCNFIIKT